MKRFKDLRIGTKQFMVLGLVILVLSASVSINLSHMARMKQEMDQVTTDWLPRVIAVSDINLNTAILRTHQMDFALAEGATPDVDQQVAIIELIDRINMSMDTYERLRQDGATEAGLTEREAYLYSGYVSKWDEYQDSTIAFFQTYESGDADAAVELLNGEMRRIFDDLSSDLQQLVSEIRASSIRAAERADQLFIDARRVSMLVFVIAVGLSIVLGGVLVRLISLPVERLARGVCEVAGGDLNVTMGVSSEDEIGNLAQSFNQMTQSLREARDKTERQAETLRRQHEELQTTHSQLEEQSERLKARTAEVEESNQELERTLHELKRTQEQLLLKEKLASLGNLVAGVTHEINTPIGAITSAVEVSRRCVERIEAALEEHKSSEDLTGSVGFIKTLRILKENQRVATTASQRIGVILRSLKNFARLDEAEYQRVDIHEGLDSVLHLIRKEKLKGISIHKRYGDLPKVSCYPARLNQAFLNLLTNAAEAIEGPGVITIMTNVEDEMVRIDIADTGRGIEDDRLDRLFDIGFSSGGRRVKMGAGLSTTYQIIQEHEGEISVSSTIGRGSMFTIRLPIR